MDQKYKCNYCDHTENIKVHLKEHIETVHGDKTIVCIRDKVKCKQCEYKGKKSDLDRHVQSVHLKIRHHCNICEKSFSNNNSLKSHIRSSHEGKRFNCNLCEFETKQTGNLKIHKQTVHGDKKIDRKRYYSHKVKCNQCEYKALKSELNIHVKSVHLKIRHQCNFCEKTFSNNGNLKSHIKSSHEGKRYNCDLLMV